MRHIISASRRTDIPAFFVPWLKERIKAGFCTVINPFRPSQVTAVNLSPEAVRCIVFWTKNPAPMLEDRELLLLLEKDYAFYFLFTLNGYPESLEPVTGKMIPSIIGTFKELSHRIGRAAVIWRYDPIIISSLTDYDFHRRNFSYLAGQLEGSSGRVVISIMDHYRTVTRRFAAKNLPHAMMPASEEELKRDPRFFELMSFIREKAASHGMAIQSCSESIDLPASGIYPGPCIDAALIARITGTPLEEAGKDPGQRSGCLCAVSRDIGAPLTCRHRCIYCYASPGDPEFKRTEKRSSPGKPREGSNDFHDWQSPSLTGWHQ